MTQKGLDLIKAAAQRSFDQKETMQWLKINMPMFWSWGARNFKIYKDLALVFRVSGHSMESKRSNYRRVL